MLNGKVKQKGKAVVVIILIIAIAIVGYFFIRSLMSNAHNSSINSNNSNNLNSQNNSTQIIDTNKPSDTTPQDNNSNLTKSYFLKTYNFGTAIQNSQSRGLVKVKDGYVMLGNDDSQALYLLKTDFSGKVIWNKSIGPKSNYNPSYSINNLFKIDNGFIAANVLETNLKDKLEIIKVNFDGFVDWNKTFDVNKISSIAITTTKENNILVSVVSYDPNSYQFDYTTTLYKIDQQGNLIWKKNITKDLLDVGSLKTISDGYLIGGMKLSENLLSTYIYLAKINTSGELVWSKELGNTGSNDTSFALLKNDVHSIFAENDGYLLVGSTNILGNTESQDNDAYSAYILKTDLQGNKQWVNTFSVLNSNEIDVITNANDGKGYVVAGLAFNSDSKDKSTIFIIKTDNSGKKIWEKDYKSVDDGSVNGIINNANGYVVTGQMYPANNPDYKKAFLLSMDESGNISN